MLVAKASIDLREKGLPLDKLFIPREWDREDGFDRFY
jgi:hypothetical protein